MRFPESFLSRAARCVLLCALGGVLNAQADIVLRDDIGREVRLKQPAQRIVSLAPHITEVLFAAGAGAQVVGAVDFSNYPPAALKLPGIGSYARLDIEAIAALKPDLALAWRSGNAPTSLAQLERLGIPVFVTEPLHIDDVARDLERYGKLAGQSQTAQPAAKTFRERHAMLRTRYAGRRPLRVFYQVWQSPLMTVGGKQIISEVICLCGGENIYARLPVLAPTVSVESVLADNPEVIVAGGMGEKNPAWLDMWRQWPSLQATARGNLFFIDPNLLQRHSPRLLDGAAEMCERLEEARSRR